MIRKRGNADQRPRVIRKHLSVFCGTISGGNRVAGGAIEREALTPWEPYCRLQRLQDSTSCRRKTMTKKTLVAIVTIITVLFCITNAAFLLHTRQCRYYALVVFAQIWLLYGYKLLMTGKPKQGGLFLVLALAVQFYCNYIVVLGNVLALCVSTVLICRRYRNLLRNIVICLASFALLTIPWLAYAKPWHQSEDISPGYFTENVLNYLSGIHFHIMPLVLVLIIPVRYFLTRRKQPFETKEPAMKDIENFLWILIPAHLVILGIAPVTFFRYLMPLIPVLIILTSVILLNYVRPLLRYMLIAILCCSNAIAVFTAYPLQTSYSVGMPFVQFVHEITSNYEDRLEDVVRYLRQNAKPDQSLYVFDHEFQLIFYIDMRVIDGRFTQTLNPNDLPDWILSESASGVIPSTPIQLPTSLIKLYEPVVLDVHDTSRQASRPGPDVHIPFTAPKMTQLVIYKKIR